MKIYLFSKEYSEDELDDLERDVSEVFNINFNPQAKYLPSDDMNGTYTLSIVYHNDKNNKDS